MSPDLAAPNNMAGGERSVYEQVGGQAFFDALVERFYVGVASDPRLLALYPTPEDLTEAKHHLALFLGQYWGGPRDYDDLRGAPRLRMRHFPFEIGKEARDRWLTHMKEAMAAMEITDPAVRSEMEAYFPMAADSLRNQVG